MSLFVVKNIFSVRVLHDLSNICPDDNLVYRLKNSEIIFEKVSSRKESEGCRLIEALCQSRFKIIINCLDDNNIIEAHGYAKTGEPIIITDKEYEVAGDPENFGYTVEHEDNASDWDPDGNQDSDNSPSPENLSHHSSNEGLFIQLSRILLKIRKIKPDYP